MKPRTQKKVLFIGRSMLWSVLLYMSMMLVINWDDVSRAMGRNAATIVANTQQQDQFTEPAIPAKANITVHAGIIKSIVVILKTVSGIASSSH